MTDPTRGERLDELNAATMVEHYRNITDRGLKGPESALYRAYGPARPTLLEALRANAEAVYGGQAEPETARRRGKAQ